MLIHAHALPPQTQLSTPLGGPRFYSYDQLRPETWGEVDKLMPCWVSRAEGLQLGLPWTHQQYSALQELTPFKIYEVVQDRTGVQAWVGIERAGYLLPQGFLPLRLTYRRSDGVARMVMPGNVGYLYNHLLGIEQPNLAGIAPQLQFMLDVETNPLGSNGYNQAYAAVQRLVPEIVKRGPHLAWDRRSPLAAYGDVRSLSQGVDMLGNAPVGSEEYVRDWLYEYLMIEPPARDLVVCHYPVGPIPHNVLQSWYVAGMIDTAVPAPLLELPGTFPLPDTAVQDILQLQATDISVAFAIVGGRLDFHTSPVFCDMQNRFGAYMPINPGEDLATIRGTLQYLWTTLRVPEIDNVTASLQLTCNDEVCISFVDLHETNYQQTFYVNLNCVTDSWLGVAQTSQTMQRGLYERRFS